MKLINVDTFQLTEANFTPGDQSNKRYAILSHTWGEGEVTFADMQTPLCRQTPGWKKIEYTCAEAKRRGLEWAWVDTCCIDKSSSSELSESINSMFRWYEEAEVCFAYLHDFKGLSSLKDCRWFERGWTLQELLAPQKVDFYDGAWSVVGTRDSLAEQIADRSLIDVETLQGKKRVSDASIARRMSWASFRSTTRIEDRAYCLLGIFGVNMPLLYGEGTRAFVRLQEEIMKTSDDHSIFAWGVPMEDAGFENYGNSMVPDNSDLGPLAIDPRLFRWSGDISSTGSLGHYSMTNQGLQITLPVGGENDPSLQRLGSQRNLRSGPSVFGLLGCKLRGQEKKLVAFHLRRLTAEPDVNRYTRQNKRGISTFLLPLSKCVGFEQKSIAITSAAGNSSLSNISNPPPQMVRHQELGFRYSHQFMDAVAAFGNERLRITRVEVKDHVRTLWLYCDPYIPNRLVFLARLRRSGTLFWVLLRNNTLAKVHRDITIAPVSKHLHAIAADRSLDPCKIFDSGSYDSFGKTALGPGNVLIHAGVRQEEIYNHRYTLVDLQYQEATAEETTNFTNLSLALGKDQKYSQRVFDSCCLGTK